MRGEKKNANDVEQHQEIAAASAQLVAGLAR
jgi:hypothetical protein